MRRVISLGLAVLLVKVGLGARMRSSPPTAPMVTAKAIQFSEVFDSLIYPARLISRVNATLMAETDGVVKTLNRRLGSRVQSGEPILTLVNPDPVYTFAPFEVHSPVAGVISALWVTQGTRVARGDKLGTITDPAQVQAAIEVTVADLSAVLVGIQGQLELPGNDEPLTVQVTGISPLVDPATGTATAELKVVQNKRLPPPGVIGRVRFRARAHQGLQLPESAIFYRGDKPLVRVLDGEQAKFREVKLGVAREGNFEILQGLKPGETVVLRTNTFISDGEKVTIEKADGEKS